MPKRKKFILGISIFIFLVLAVFPVPSLKSETESVVFISYEQLEQYQNSQVNESYTHTQWTPSSGLLKWRETTINYRAQRRGDQWQFYKCDNISTTFAGLYFFTGFAVERATANFVSTNSHNDTLSISVKGRNRFLFFAGRSQTLNIKIILVP